MTEKMTAKTVHVDRILEILAQAYPEAKCGLNFRNSFELLIATILSAQTTDQKVNQVTPDLFRDYPDPKRMAEMSPDQLEKYIHPIGLFRTKARNILETCRILTESYQGCVPNQMEELLQLPGVGRKTASVVLANAFGIPAFPVDTHVLRLANRLGFSSSQDPLKVEKDLTALIEKKQWIDCHHRLIAHGRQVCSAKKPQCSACPLASYCPSKTDSLS